MMEEERQKQVNAGGRFEMLFQDEHVHALQFRADTMPTKFTHDDSFKAALRYCLPASKFTISVEIFEWILDSKHVIQYTYNGQYRIMHLYTILANERSSRFSTRSLEQSRQLRQESGCFVMVPISKQEYTVQNAIVDVGENDDPLFMCSVTFRTNEQKTSETFVYDPSLAYILTVLRPMLLTIPVETTSCSHTMLQQHERLFGSSMDLPWQVMATNRVCNGMRYPSTTDPASEIFESQLDPDRKIQYMRNGYYRIVHVSNVEVPALSENTVFGGMMLHGKSDMGRARVAIRAMMFGHQHYEMWSRRQTTLSVGVHENLSADLGFAAADNLSADSHSLTGLRQIYPVCDRFVVCGSQILCRNPQEIATELYVCRQIRGRFTICCPSALAV